MPVKGKKLWRCAVNWYGEVHVLYSHAATFDMALWNISNQLGEKVRYETGYVHRKIIYDLDYKMEEVKKMPDKTEKIRKEMVSEINASPGSREALEATYGADNVWDTGELTREFEVIGFMAPLCTVKKKNTGRKGTVMFQHRPRFYFDFKEAE